MGLCKCPKKKVTNLFCFEHRVNVCEHCIVENHQSCVVQSYLQWLTDSDYDTNCTFCQDALSNGQTVRLQCLHLIHLRCLDNWASGLPPTTAPAGFRCPCCNEAIFPSQNQTSPTIDVLRATLSKCNWAQVGLGMPAREISSSGPDYWPAKSLPPSQGHGTTLTTLAHAPTPSHAFTTPPTHPSFPVRPAAQPVYDENISHVNHNYRSSTPATVLDVENVSYGASNENVKFKARKHGAVEDDREPLMFNQPQRDDDSDANKYKRRPAREWLRGIWRAKYGNRSPIDGMGGYCRPLLLVLLLIVILVIVITVLTQVTSSGSEDPMFDPMANPNIRIAAEDSLGNHI